MLFIPVHRGVVEYRGDGAILVFDLQGIVLNFPLLEDVLITSFCFFGLGEVPGKVGADEFLPGTTRGLFSGFVHVGDLTIGADGDQGIQSSFDEVTVVGVGYFQLLGPFLHQFFQGI